jgi:hypothetical protein
MYLRVILEIRLNRDWAIFSVFSLHRYLFEVDVDLKVRERCIESMYYVFADAIIPLGLDVTRSFYWMWWDYILMSCGCQERENTI